MKVLLIHNSYKNFGGEDRVFELEYQGLVAALSEENVFAYRVYSKDIRYPQQLVTVFFSLKHYRAVYRLVKQHQIEIVHVHNFFPVLSTSVFMAAKKAGAKIVHTLHNYRWWCANGLLYRNGVGICNLCVEKKNRWYAVKYRCYRNSLLQSIVATMAFWFYNRINTWRYIDQFWVLTRFEEAFAKQHGIAEEKIVYKPNWIAKLPYKEKQKREGYVYIGRLEEAKGIVHLLQLWAMLPQSYRLTIVGTGSLAVKLMEAYKRHSHIIFKGHLPSNDTMEVIETAKYSIQPSVWYETFGLTIIESMCVGVPVIGLDIGGRKELIKNGINGFLTDINRLKEVIEASAMIEDHAYASLCNEALDTASQFEQKYLLEKQLNYYTTLIAQ